MVARKPLDSTVAANVTRWGTGALNIDATRVQGPPSVGGGSRATALGVMNDDGWQPQAQQIDRSMSAGRWPTNVVLDGSQADALDEQSGITQSKSANRGRRCGSYLFGGFSTVDELRTAAQRGELTPDGKNSAAAKLAWYEASEGTVRGHSDEGGASRFFPTFRYQAKAPTRERPSYVDANGVKQAHSTVKPLELMKFLVRLVTPPGGTCLEPFAGSGTTVEACILEGFRVIAIEREADYLPLIMARIERQAPAAVDAPTVEVLSLFDDLDGDVA